jgi:L-alanine-DL-glutamate epimerase-like enolase superfamily enzyme
MSKNATSKGMKIRTSIERLHPRDVFRISRAERSEVRNVFLEIESRGIVAYGEASPNAYYGESADVVKAKLDALSAKLGNRSVENAEDIALLWADCWKMLAPSRAAQCALDVALWDLLGKKRRTSVTRLIFGHDPKPVTSFATIGLSKPSEFESKLDVLQRFPRIKIKSGPEADDAIVQRVLTRTNAHISIDANGAWDPELVEERLVAVANPRALFVEQPLPPSADARMCEILARSPLPVMADESCVTLDDVERMPGCFSGFNIKLVKCGGLTPALAMLQRGRELGLIVMVGCMLESSLLVSAGAVIAQHCDFADLDGAWLLADDPFEGAPFKDGIISLTNESGFGVRPFGNLSGQESSTGG